METGNSAGALLPLGDFLTTEEPVWIWDAVAKRILWANQAGRAFWGVSTLKALQTRRFSPKSKSVERLSLLAANPEGSKETVEMLTLNAASGRRSLKCHVQGLQVAGGRPGLIVKALDTPSQRAPRVGPAKSAASAAQLPRKGSDIRRGLSKSDNDTLNAIAARLNPASSIAQDEQSQPGQTKDIFELRELSHELRNPLTVILGFAERIKSIAPEGRAQAKLRAYANNVIEGANLALAILTDFTDRVAEPGHLRRSLEKAEVKSAAESCLRLITPLAKGAGIKVGRRMEANLPPLPMPERVLKQILLNLLINAIRHHKTGGLLKLAARRRKDRTVRLTVSDDGKGMTKKAIKAIMQGRPARASDGSARAGVGLPLVKRLVEEAGGKFAIESGKGKGTKVEIILPVAA